MAGSLRRAAPGAGTPGRERRGLGLSLLLVLLLHAVALAVLSRQLQPPSLLAQVTAPLYTRTITVQAPTTVPTASVAVEATAAPARPTARLASAEARQARKPSQTPPDTPTAEPEAPQAVSAQPQPEPEPVREPEPEPAPEPDPVPEPETPGQTAEADGTTAEESEAADAAPTAPAFLETWPLDTRMTYRLGGNYRGELHGRAEVLWQREDTRYQAVVQLDVGLLLSSRFTSQGRITERGLAPEVYEEQVRQRRRGVRLGPDTIHLKNDQRVARPDGVQDAASQFVELSHRFASGQVPLAAGTHVQLWLARPGGVDEWTYDVLDEETLYLPRLGAVRAWHLKPRRLGKPEGPISAEIWYAPSLQYLPVRILLTQGPDTWMDLMVETIEQQ